MLTVSPLVCRMPSKDFNLEKKKYYLNDLEPL